MKRFPLVTGVVVYPITMLFLLIFFVHHAHAVILINGSEDTVFGDWTGTSGDDVYINQGNVTGNIDMTQGGTDEVYNSGTVEGGIIMGTGGGNIVENSGDVSTTSVVLGIIGSDNAASEDAGGANTIENYGIVYYDIIGSYNLGYKSSGGYNKIINHAVGMAMEDIIGSYNSRDFTVGGNNNIHNDGYAYGDIYGSKNFGAGSTGDGNYIENNSYMLYSIYGSSNTGISSSGSNNHIVNTGTIGSPSIPGYLYGSYNTGYSSSGGSNVIKNTGYVTYIIGSQNGSTMDSGTGASSIGGSSGITNDTTGDVKTIIGSFNNGRNSSGGFNTITNHGDVSDTIIGSHNSGDGSSGGSNAIKNTSSDTVGGSIIGSYNIVDSSEGGENTLYNSGTVGDSMVGSYNYGAHSSGGDNTITNSGLVTTILNGSFNSGDSSSGGSNAITNSGTVKIHITGSHNGGTGSSGGSNTITNSGTVYDEVDGSANEGANSSGGSNTITNTGSLKSNLAGSYNAGTGSSGSINTITNKGVVADDAAGTYNLGSNSSGGGNEIINYGTFEKSLYGTLNEGSGTSGGGNTIYLMSGSTVGYDVYGTYGGTDTGIDTLYFFGGSSVGRNVGGFDMFNKMGSGVVTIGGNLDLNGADVYVEMYSFETQVLVDGDVTGATGSLTVAVLGGEFTHGQTVDVFGVGPIDTWSSEYIGDDLADWEFVLLNGQVTVLLAGYEDENNANTPSGAVTSKDTLPRQFNAYRTLLNQRFANLFAPRPPRDQENGEGGNNLSYRLEQGSSGLAAGDAAQAARWGLWANGQVSVQRNTSGSSRYNGIVFTTLAGVDYIIADGLVAGLGLGHDQTWLDTKFNDGSFTSSGFTLTPYLTWAIMDGLVWDLSGAVGVVVNNQERNKSTFDYDSEYESYRTMIGTNINYYHLWNDWSFNVGAGFMYANEYAESYTEKGVLGLRSSEHDADVYVGEFNFTGGMKYYFDYVAPYLNVTYLWSPWISESDYSNDRDEVEVAFGIDLQPTDDVVISLEVSKSLMRNFVETTNAMCSFRVAF